MAKPDRPLIVRRVTIEGGHGHHGGAWKVAYADFVTAMMAFFLLLWLLSTAEGEKLAGLAEFFSDSQMNTGPPGGVGGLLDGIDVSPGVRIEAPSSPFDTQPTLPFSAEDQAEYEELTPNYASGADGGTGRAGSMADAAFEREQERREQERFDAAADALEEALADAPALAKFKDNLKIEETPEGLRIQIVDQDKESMFPVGSDQMYPHTRQLLAAVATAVAGMQNRLSIRGHTDSRAYASDARYDNWRLSSDRANATRSVLLTSGLDPRRVLEVVGKADAEPLLPDQPTAANNRRISIVLMNERP